ncbi:GNAT family N-acetyltransferase [Bacteroidota bacterium]
MNIFDEIPELTLGSRLKRLSDQLMKGVTEVYKKNNVLFEPKWFPMVYVLIENSSMSISELASNLKLTHPAIIQFTNELKIKGLIKVFKDKNDGRKTLIKLSEKGMKLVGDMQTIWKALEYTIKEINNSHQNNLLFAIEEYEKTIEELSFDKRIMSNFNNLKMDKVEIIDYTPKYLEDFKNINLNWIQKYFEIEELDLKMLQNPKSYIIDKGGYVFLAKVENKIVGTCSLIKEDNDSYELSKMAVLEEYQGQQIGKKLCLHAINRAREMKASEIFLVSNTALQKAMGLYKKVGFRKVELVTNGDSYNRNNIKMVLEL